MAMTKMAKDDFITQSFGEISQTAQNGTYGLTVGGIYQSSPVAIADGEFSPLNVDTSGNLMVNLASGEAILTLGTIDMIKAGTIDKVAGGTIDMLKAGTIDKLAGGTVDMIKAGTINAATVVAPIFSAAQTITVGSGKTSGTSTSTLNGMIWKITQTTPALQGTPGSAATFLTDAAGGTIASLGTQAESSIASYGTQVPINTDFKWITNTSGDPDGTQTADVNVVVLVHYQK